MLINVFNVDTALAVGRAQSGMFAADGTRSRGDGNTQLDGSDARARQALVADRFDGIRQRARLVGTRGRGDRGDRASLRKATRLPVYVRPEIKTWDDLRGKALAVDAVDTAYALVLRRVLLAHGLEMDRGDYTLIAKGTTGLSFGFDDPR